MALQGIAFLPMTMIRALYEKKKYSIDDKKYKVSTGVGPYGTKNEETDLNEENNEDHKGYARTKTVSIVCKKCGGCNLRKYYFVKGLRKV